MIKEIKYGSYFMAIEIKKNKIEKHICGPLYKIKKW